MKLIAAAKEISGWGIASAVLLILFLVRDGNRFNRISGGSFAFPVRGGRVLTHGFRGLPDVVNLEAFRVALQELAR